MKQKELKLFALVLIAVLTFLEFLFFHNAYYTEGEVRSLTYFSLILINVPLFVAAFWKPRYPAWISLGIGAVLIAWQASENTKLAKLHEEVVSIIQYANESKKEDGAFPVDLANYEFVHPGYKDNYAYACDTKKDEFTIIYFIDQPGISFWYHSDTGFGYYGD